jgi:2-polyprenyl-6-methoxyphenol hydroxylase-like FAD-dependent oxidoreductase
MHPKRTLDLAEGFPDSFVDVVRHSNPNFVTRTFMLYRSPWGLLLGRPHRDLVTVAGDAYHPIASDLSLGSCMALEDAIILARHISNHLHNDRDLKEVIEAYVKEKRWRVAALLTWSYLSFWAHHSWSGWGFLGRVVKFFGNKLFDWFVRPRIV